MATEKDQTAVRKRKTGKNNIDAKNEKGKEKKDIKNVNKDKKNEGKKEIKNVNKEKNKQEKKAKDKTKKDKKTGKKTPVKKSKRSLGQIAKRREKREEERASLNNKTIKAIKKHWLYNYLLQFSRDHYIITAVTVVSTLFLIGLQLAVEVSDDRHPSKHPNITDHVTFSMKIKKGPPGDLVFGLYGNDCPKTVKNFIMLVNHDNGYGYEDSKIYTIIKQRMIMGGDIVNNDGTSGKSALGEPFEEENLKLRHKIRGTLGMMTLKNNEDSSHSSQFYITLGDCSNFDGQMVIIGHLLEGLPYLSALERVPTDESMAPKQRITIVSTKHKVVKN